jgi:hypothetical protein
MAEICDISGGSMLILDKAHVLLFAEKQIEEFK